MKFVLVLLCLLLAGCGSQVQVIGPGCDAQNQYALYNAIIAVS